MVANSNAMRFYGPLCKMMKNIGGFGILFLMEISKPSEVGLTVVFNQSIDFLRICNTKNIFQTFGIVFDCKTTA